MKKIARKLMALFLTFAMLISCVEPVSAADTTVHFQVTYMQSQARSMLKMINDFRTGSDAWYWNSDDTTKTTCTGLSELTYDYELEKIAMQRCAEIALSFSHTRPNGASCFTAVQEAGYSYYALGENIAAGYTTASSVFAGWQETDCKYSGQGHRRNMLSGNFNRIGISGCKIGTRCFWVQVLAYSSTANSQTSVNDSQTTVTVSASTLTTSITISTSTLSVEAKQSTALPTATTKIYGASGNVNITSADSVTWSVDDTSIAKISGATIIGVSEGSTTLTASIYGTTQSIPVTVTPHVHVYDSEVITKAPTCAETGVKTLTCSVCGGTKEETVAKTTNHTYNSGVITKAPTCAETGVKTLTCSICGGTKTEPVAKTTNHIYDSGVITKAPTCAKTGVKTFTCSVCKNTKTEPVEKTTVHTWNAGTVTIPATIETTGTKTLTCTLCGETKEEIIPVLDPIPVADLKVVNTTTGTKLTWNPVDCSGYFIYRADGTGEASYIDAIHDSAASSYTDSLTQSGDYTYEVVAFYLRSNGGITKSDASAVSIHFLPSVKPTLTNVSTGIKLTWSKVEGASGYKVYRKSGSASFTSIKTISASSLAYTDTSTLTNGTVYTYAVRPYYKNADGTTTYASYTAKSTYRITTVTQSTPLNETSKTMTVKWTKNSKATGYQIQYGTSSSFSGAKTISVSGASTVTKKIGSLTKGKTYYVRVRAYKKNSAGTNYYGGWSSKKSVKITK